MAAIAVTMSPKRQRSAADDTVTSDTVAAFLASSAEVGQFDARIRELTSELQAIKLARKQLLHVAHVVRKAQSVYYHEHKARTDILTEVTERLTRGGLYVERNGKPIIPWRIVREYTDREFDALSLHAKKKYFAKVLAA